MKLVLDEHLPPAVAVGLRMRFPEIEVLPFQEWRGGELRGKPDEEALRAAAEDGFTFVTFDLRTIPRLLRDWAAAGIDHAGVLFCDDKTISPNDVGRLVRQLGRVYAEAGNEDWTNRAGFLEKD